MTNEEKQVRLFYTKIWNQYEHQLIPEVLDENISFRGSLGQVRHGHVEFKAYLDMVHASLGEYQCLIDDLVCAPDKAAARMTFTGIHLGDLLGVAATGKRVSWSGAALFTFVDGKVTDLWVLGDLVSLQSQLQED